MKTKTNKLKLDLSSTNERGICDTVIELQQESTVSVVLADCDLEELREKWDGALDRFFQDLQVERRRQIRERKVVSDQKHRERIAELEGNGPGF